MHKRTVTRWRFRDVEKAAQEHPATFEIPTLAERQQVKIGMLVKLHLVFDKPVITEAGRPIDTERMWVVVIQAQSGKYRGLLANDPFFIANLSSGSVLEFSAEHIGSIEEPPENFVHPVPIV